MFKKLFVIIFLSFASCVSIANTNADGHVDILIAYDWGVFINVKYQIIKENGQIINGRSDADGWIRFNGTITGEYTLLLDFEPFSGWDWGEDDDVYKQINNLRLNDGYKVIEYYKGHDRIVEVFLNGNEKYIIVVEFPVFEISF